MDRSLIVDFLKEYEGFNPFMIPRELDVEPDDRFVVSIIGPRRAGKNLLPPIEKKEAP